MKPTHYITNLKTREYVKTTKETFDGDWRLKYQHCKNYTYPIVTAFTIYEEYEANGIPFVYDLCPSGGLFTLLIDKNKHSKEQIKKAVNSLKRERDVVTLKKLYLKEWQEQPEIWDAFQITEQVKGKPRWLSIGIAFRNRDESINIFLDAFPKDGKVQLRNRKKNKLKNKEKKQ